MGTSQREAVLTLIYKKGDRNQIKNYRPISLTYIDYTILEFTLSQRIKKVTPSIDFEKAFDSLEHPFLFETLKKV